MLDRAEFRAYIRFVIRTNRWPQASFRFLRAATKRLDRKDSQPAVCPAGLLDTDVPQNDQSFRVHLATGKATWNGDWFTGFPDQEDSFALHRLGWLLRYLVDDGITEQTIRQAWSWVDRWANAMRSQKSHPPAWQSYTVSERICNLVVLARLSPIPPVRQRWLSDFLSCHAAFLMKKLEYRGELTNNHLLNNARALYLCGQHIDRPEYADKGRAILTRELPARLSPGGFLNEDSTHYHFLVLRSCLEVWRIAQSRADQPFANTLREHICVMAAAAEDLLLTTRVGYEVPLFGDISPDCPPEWLIGTLMRAQSWLSYPSRVDNSRVAPGWHLLWV